MFSEALTVSLFHFLICSLFADKERNRKKTFSVGYHPDSVSLRFVKWVHLIVVNSFVVLKMIHITLSKSKTILNSRWCWYLVLVIHLDHLCFDNALCDVHLVTKIKEIDREKEYTTYLLTIISIIL